MMRVALVWSVQPSVNDMKFNKAGWVSEDQMVQIQLFCGIKWTLLEIGRLPTIDFLTKHVL